VRTAKEWANLAIDASETWDRISAMESLIDAVQREALEEAAKECERIATGDDLADPDLWSADDCAEAIRALLPKDPA
jgi:hypothetical protein